MRAEVGESATISPQATVGYEYNDDVSPTVLGTAATVRAGTVIYCDVAIGASFVTGHNALVREHTTISDDVVLGTNAVIDGKTEIGSHVSLQTGVYVPSQTTIGDNVFLGPHAVLTNDRYPVRSDGRLSGPTIEDGVTIGANATVLPDVTIGEHSFVAAGAVVTTDIPPNSLVVGVPASHEPLPPELDTRNRLEQ
ncbi:acyltransferase [Haloarcula amylolytica]|uniref:Transferase hexapeptide repeat containing protein n=1 Tax=Haloarcula amylolytica JCM 13557 TaxID=1227452 RepID=M0KHA9_9EURY|nr:acyltransferase [Haloarcula amylolytica]EMA19529.1 transferase hexapeptide repeat containing protein [Haloarcula amylolytica JCM 13557]